jgi:hypothetical protein
MNAINTQANPQFDIIELDQTDSQEIQPLTLHELQYVGGGSGSNNVG